MKVLVCYEAHYEQLKFSPDCVSYGHDFYSVPALTEASLTNLVAGMAPTIRNNFERETGKMVPLPRVILRCVVPLAE